MTAAPAGRADSGLRFGYACVNTQLPSAARTVRLANVTPERLRTLIAANLDALEAILRWNDAHGIQVFRLTSDLVPFGSHGANGLAWWDEFGERFAELGASIRAAGARISTHPGPYTVLSSTRPDVVAAAVAELEYHGRMLAAFGLDLSHKIVLHVGAGAADPAGAYERFAAGLERLSPQAAGRLVLENDERWPLEAVLAVAEPLGLPVVFDASTTPSHRRLPASAFGSSPFARRGPGGPATDGRRCISRRNSRASAPARTRTRSTSPPSKASSTPSWICRSTACSRSRTRSARCCAPGSACASAPSAATRPPAPALLR